MANPFDAVLVVAFGGPQGPDDVRPFLGNVLRGRRVAPGRIDEVAHHYEMFGGVSPLTELTKRQAELLRTRLGERGVPLPVYVGMRNWHPYLADTLGAMSRDGVRTAVGFIAAAQRSYSSCTQYRENVEAARAALRDAGLPDVEIVYAGDWHTAAGFIDANADHIVEAIAQLPERVRDRARIVFTAHSIPVSMAERFPYQRQLEESAQAVAARVGRLRDQGSGIRDPEENQDREAVRNSEEIPPNGSRVPNPASREEHVADPGSRHDPEWALVYQSRSGRPEDPWLGPDVCDYLRQEAANGLTAAVLCPIGFLCDHIEVLYDLDVEAASACRDIGLPVVRAKAVNDHPRFVDAMADAVIQTVERYRRGTPLSIVNSGRSSA